MKTFGNKTIDALPEKHKVKIHSISDERENGDGWWIYLNDDYRDYEFDSKNPVQTIHEQSLSVCISRLRASKPVITLP